MNNFEILEKSEGRIEEFSLTLNREQVGNLLGNALFKNFHQSLGKDLERKWNEYKYKAICECCGREFIETGSTEIGEELQNPLLICYDCIDD